MKKIYFAPAWGLSNEEMTNWYKRQTPKNSGVWGNIESTYDIKNSDYIIMQETTTLKNIDKTKTIFFGKEPYYIAKNSCNNCLKEFHFEKGNSWFPQTWWVDIPYDELKKEQKINKTKKLSAINSNKKSTKGQRIRYNIIESLVKNYNDIDVWGSMTRGKKNKGPYKDILPPKDKKNGLLPYKYHLSIENVSKPFYFSEKIIDPLLCWSMPIYWGCSKIDKFLPKGSYVKIDIDDPNVIDKIIEISESDIREQNLDKISEAREIILNKYNLWPTIEKSLFLDNLIINI